MRVVVNEACDDDDDRMDVLEQMPCGCVPTVVGEDWDPQGEHSRPECRDPKKKGGWWWYEFKEDARSCGCAFGVHVAPFLTGPIIRHTKFFQF